MSSDTIAVNAGHANICDNKIKSVLIEFHDAFHTIRCGIDTETKPIQCLRENIRDRSFIINNQYILHSQFPEKQCEVNVEPALSLSS